MKYAWYETAWDEIFLYLPFKLLINMFKRIFIKTIAFYTPTTHLLLYMLLHIALILESKYK